MIWVPHIRSSGNATTDDLGQVLTYDAWNRLINVSSAVNGATIKSYAYDGGSRRIEEAAPGVNPTELYYDASWQVIEEDTGASGNTLHAQYVWSPVYVDAMVLRDYDFTGNGAFQLNERVYVTQDANYNVTGLIIRITGSSLATELPDSNGDGSVGFAELLLAAQHYGQTIAGGAAVGDYNNDGVVNFADLLLASQDDGDSGSFTWVMALHFDYDAYGQSTSYNYNWTATNANFLAWNYTFEGGRQDSATGFINFDYRDYNPRTYTWNTKDPLQLGADFYQAFADNPINRLDWTGLAVQGEPGWTGGMVRPAPKMTPIELKYDFMEVPGLDFKDQFADAYGGFKNVANATDATKDMQDRLKADGCTGHYIDHLTLAGHGLPFTLGPYGNPKDTRWDLDSTFFANPDAQPELKGFLDEVGENIANGGIIELLGCNVGNPNNQRTLQLFVQYFKVKFGKSVVVRAPVGLIDFGWLGNPVSETTGLAPAYTVVDESGVSTVPAESPPSIDIDSYIGM